MAHRFQRRLSEVEIQVLEIETNTSEKLTDSSSTDEINNLAPPSLDELESISLPSLEELHMEHAYTSLHSQIERDVKERMKHYGRLSRRKSYHGTTEKEDKKEMNSDNECGGKGRRSRRGSSDRHKRKSYGLSGKQFETMTESEKTRRDRRKNYEKSRRRLSYHGQTSKQKNYDVMVGNQRIEYVKSFEILQRSRSCGARPIRETTKETIEIESSSDENIREKFRDQLQQLSIAVDVYDEKEIDQLGLVNSLEELLNKFNRELSFENRESTVGRKDTLTGMNDSDDDYHHGRKNTLVSPDEHRDFLTPRKEGTLENG